MRLASIFILCTVASCANCIIGGNSSRSGQFPFMAGINVRTETSRFFCGGALISQVWILTAGRCTYGALSVTIYLGSAQLEGNDSNSIITTSYQVVTHPEFNPVSLENDAGLVRLQVPVEYSVYVQPIALPSADSSVSMVATALGWGQTTDYIAQLAPVLNFVQLAVISNAECRNTYGNQIVDNMVCAAGNYNQGSCIGDSGGPLVAGFQHIGISSFYSGNGCESTDPSGYTRTYPYVAWIKNVMNGV